MPHRVSVFATRPRRRTLSPHPELGRAPGAFLVALGSWWAAIAVQAAGDFTPCPQAFRQEAARAVPHPRGLTLLELRPGGEILVCDGRGFFVTRPPAAAGSPLRLEPLPPSPTADGAAPWPPATSNAAALPCPLSAVQHVLRPHPQKQTVWLATAKGAYCLDGSHATLELADFHVRQMTAVPGTGQILAATDRGLWMRSADAATGAWTAVEIRDGAQRNWAERDVRGVAIGGPGGRWWVATPAGVASGTNGHWTFYTGREGLPYADFTGVAAGPGADVWFGTRRGAIRFDGTNWAYREGPRWLPGNEVRSLVLDPEGRAWFATDQGLGVIEREPMTLASKADRYEDEIERLIKRTPYGFTSEVDLERPGDRSGVTRSDSDNDGLWTAMYGAGECFAYGATRRPVYQRRAQQAFEALRFLQKATQGSPHRPPQGFVARTIRPVTDPDPNVGRVESDRRQRAEGDRLWKVYEPRWPRSADGQWYWKSDTSSDELDGHFFFYAAYYDLVAGTDAERTRVREVVRDLADHLLAHDFALVDHDGHPTRWGVFGPQALNHSPAWWVERGLNSLSIVAYLTVAEHITGEPRYGQAVRELVDRHGYGANIMNAKTQMGLGSGNQSDDEMAFMAFYSLLRYTRESSWLNAWRFGFHAYWALEQPERNPFFHFAYAASGQGASYTNAFGSLPIDPWPGWLEDALDTLRGFPIDRVNWAQHNSHRLDLVRLPPQQAIDPPSPDRRARGYRVDGKVLPIEERHFNHWNTDPWNLDYPGDGRVLASGTVFLLPYYMGLYHGFIEKPTATP